MSRPHAAVQPLSYNPGRNQPTGALKLLWCGWVRLPILLSDLRWGCNHLSLGSLSLTLFLYHVSSLQQEKRRSFKRG